MKKVQLFQSLKCYPFLIIYLKTFIYHLLYTIRQTWLKIVPPYLIRYIIFQLFLFCTMRVRRTSVKKLVHKHAKWPDICCRAIYIMLDALWWHVDWWADAYVLKLLSFYIINLKYFDFEWIANPKSAILALPLCRNMLATLISLWMMLFSDKYKRPLNTPLIIGAASYYNRGPFLSTLLSKSPPSHNYIIT